MSNITKNSTFVNVHTYIIMYQLVLYENNKKIKVLYTYQRRYDALYRFNLISKKTVSLKKEVIYKEKVLTKVKYKVFLFKKREEDDKSVIVRDEYGKLLEDVMNDPNWVVLNYCDHPIEEYFSVTGANRKLSAYEILRNVLLNKLSEKNTKQVLILNNKIVIESLVINMVTCKNVEEAIRLYNYLRVNCFEQKIENILFFGNVHKQDRKIWYKKIHNATGVGYNRLYRKMSR